MVLSHLKKWAYKLNYRKYRYQISPSPVTSACNVLVTVDNEIS